MLSEPTPKAFVWDIERDKDYVLRGLKGHISQSDAPDCKYIQLGEPFVEKRWGCIVVPFDAYPERK